MTAAAPLWVQWLAAALIVIGSLFALAAALGMVLLRDGFQRLHPPALASTCGAWCMSAAALAYFSALERAPALYVWLIPALLAIAVPVSTLLIARAALFRQRQAGDPGAPPPFQTGPPPASDSDG
ncbi:MAG: Na+/H+ antiporter subunit G [Burkholderiaceae bacterium]|jgi:multicomponent K+:H+ antiporter subunit G|nr:Na+/H+ antiporter subunit G [Burkholderiaceae bacterium]